MEGPQETNCEKELQQLCQAACKLHQSSLNQLQQNFRYYINFYIQHRKLSDQFFICLCQHSILQKMFANSSKSLPSIVTLQLFHLLISNINKENDLVYIFSQPIVHEYLFEGFNIYKESGEAIQYYVQLLKTIIMKMQNKGNEFLIKMFCNKRFPTFPLLTVSTILGVSQTCDELVRITAQQCILLLINVINRQKTGLVYLNQLQLIVFFYELARLMLDDQANTDREGSIKYFIDLVFTLRNNQTSLYLLFNLLVNNLFFKNRKNPEKILRFIGQLRDHLNEYPEFENDLGEDLLKTLFRIFNKYYIMKFINYTYFCAQQIIPNISIKTQPKLLKFYSQRCKKIEDYLINEQDYFKSEQGNQCLIQEWLQFNNSSVISPTKSKKVRNSFSELLSTTDSVADKYIQDIMLMAGLKVQKLKTPIIKLTFSCNFKTAVFLTQTIMSKAAQAKKKQKIIHQQYCKEDSWVIQPNQFIFIEIYKIFLKVQAYQSSLIISNCQMEGETQFIEHIKLILAKIITQQLCKDNINLSKNYLLILFKILHKLRLNLNLEPHLIEKLLQRLFNLQKIIGESVFYDEKMPSFLNYVIKNQERPYLKQKIELESFKKDKIKLDKPKQVRLQHYLFYYQVIKSFLDPSLKMLNQFVEEYWRINFGNKQAGKGLFKVLMLCRDSQNNYIQVCANEKFQFQVTYKNKTEVIAKFKINDKDFFQNKEISTVLRFEEFKMPIKLSNVMAFQSFRKDIQAIRETRKETLRVALLEYMPFIYQSIEVKYRNHRYESHYKQTPS